MQSSSQTIRKPGIKVTRSNGDVLIVPFSSHVSEWSLEHVRHAEPSSIVELCEWDNNDIKDVGYFIGEFGAFKA